MSTKTPFRLSIGGRAVETDTALSVTDPATGEVYAMAPCATREQLHEAVAAARLAFPAWAALPLSERQGYIAAIGQCLSENLDELADVLVREQGKPRSSAEAEVGGCIYWCTMLAQTEIPVQLIEDTAERSVEVHHVPLGVVGAITAWNYPLMIVVFKMLPALLAGNTVVVKPSPYTPLTALRFGEMLLEILPPGVLNVVSGDDSLGPALVEHPDVAKISFTGSTATGKKIIAGSARSIKRLTLELGGNDAAIVLPDVDIEKTAEAVFWGAFENSGQLCVAAKRIYIHSSIYDEFLAAFVAYGKSIKVGSGYDEGVRLGPVQNAMQFGRVRELIDDCIARGFDFALGGGIHEGPGYFVPVTVVDNPTDDARVVQEEPFGPVVPLLKYQTVEEAIGRANNSNFGLAASVWSKDLDLARSVASRLEAGTVWINEIHSMSPDRVFAGRKQSGFGAEHGLMGLLEFTSPQAFVMNKAV